MTEAQWLASGDPRAMLTFLRQTMTDRQRLSFTRACGRRHCRCCWGLEREVSALSREPGYRPVRRPAIERLATRLIELSEVQSDGADRRREIEMLRQSIAELEPEFSYRSDLVAAVDGDVEYWLTRHLPRSAEESWILASLFREVVVNPFREIRLDPNWLAPDVAAIARAAYEEHLPPDNQLDPIHLRVLADALEDAGCTIDALLSHLRGPGVHVRGCWVVDLILGKQ